MAAVVAEGYVLDVSDAQELPHPNGVGYYRLLINRETMLELLRQLEDLE